MTRCTGHCCKSFWLPLDPAQLRFQAKLATIGKSKWDQKDVVKINEMVIYQRPHENGGYRYTCKYFDKSTGNCNNYDNRPKMCSGYPYGNECKYKGCTMKEDF